jgi:hypothetical protein
VSALSITLDEFIRVNIAAHVSDLGKLSSAPANDALEQKKAVLLEHLRSLFRLRRRSFSSKLIEKVKQFSSINPNATESKALPGDAEGEVGQFEVGKRYLSEHGIFKVLRVTP